MTDGGPRTTAANGEEAAGASARTTTRRASGASGRGLLAAIAFPVFYVLNRPALQGLAELAYDFALRWNGFAINFPGRHGIGIAEARFLQSHLAEVGDGLLFDVGANDGSYTRYLRQVAPRARIHAFEPHPRTFASLRARAAGPGITLVNRALSDASGTMQLHDFADSDGSTQASLGRDAVRMYGGGVVSHDVDVTTLDDYAAANGIEEIAFLKVDTEGFDINVLRGARDMIGRGAIRAIQFEIIPADVAMRVSVRDFFEVLRDYDLFRLCLNGALIPLRRYDVKRCEVYVTHNIVALRR